MTPPRARRRGVNVREVDETDASRQFAALPWSFDDIDAATVGSLDADTLTEWLRLAWERGYDTRQIDRSAGMPGTVWHTANPYEKPEPTPQRRRGWLPWRTSTPR